MHITFITTGGTIDKVYFDDKSAYEVGEPQVREILEKIGVAFDFDVIPILRKDSLHITDEDRQCIVETVAHSQSERLVLTHGTDTMVATAQALHAITGKTIVLTGSLTPARFRESDAVFNIGCAVAAVQTLPAGVYIVMNGRIFDPKHVQKNREKNVFEAV